MPALPALFADWFAERGWEPHAHQLSLLRGAKPGSAQLLIAPTGGGKTLAGFLPSLVELSKGRGQEGLHTLYVSPLKALAADIRRNLERPVEEMRLGIRVEDRTGDTSQSARARQRKRPPDMLLTTPESLALMLSDPYADDLFAGLRAVIVDEAHALAGSKRGDQLALGLARLRRLAPGHRRIGLSATVRDAKALAAWLDPAPPAAKATRVVRAEAGPPPVVGVLDATEAPPWATMNARHAAPDVMEAIRDAHTSIVFINTRAQAEIFFQALWAQNEEGLEIGLHHGSLAMDTRLKVEAAMAAGELRAVVATSSLDLGIDWGAVDLVIQVGAPKNVARLVQRIGRANHRLDEPSRALLVPANRFDLLECLASVEAVAAGEIDGDPIHEGALDVLCQHILLVACTGPFEADALYDEVRLAGPYAGLTREDFDRCVEFCATGGYALRAYDRWKRLIERDGHWQLRDPRSTRRIRMNVGTIVAPEMIGVRAGTRRAGGGPKLGEVEEIFASTLRPGDSFLIGGEVVRYDAMREMTIQVTRNPGAEPKVPMYAGSKMPLSGMLADRVIAILQDRERWRALPGHTASWLSLQASVSKMPRRDRLLAETFPHGGREHLVYWSFAGRNAHQTLGLIVTKRMEEAGLAPLGFVANDYGLMIYGLDPVEDPASMIEIEGLRDGLDRWMSDSTLMKRTFRAAATVAGLIERNFPGLRKTGRQATVSSDVLFDTLVRYDPGHLMLDVTRREAMRGMVDFDRIEDLIARVRGRVDHMRLNRVSPLSVSLMMEAGREKVAGSAEERILMEEFGFGDLEPTVGLDAAE